MKFEQTATLIGVVAKKANGTFDDGRDWATDRIELHVVAPFQASDENTIGSTVTTYNVADCVKHFGRAKGMIDQEITLYMEMIPPKKLGATPKIICTDFRLSRDPRTLQSNPTVKTA